MRDLKTRMRDFNANEIIPPVLMGKRRKPQRHKEHKGLKVITYLFVT
jgi:hypothetical protein